MGRDSVVRWLPGGSFLTVKNSTAVHKYTVLVSRSRPLSRLHFYMMR